MARPFVRPLALAAHVAAEPISVSQLDVGEQMGQFERPRMSWDDLCDLVQQLSGPICVGWIACKRDDRWLPSIAVVRNHEAPSRFHQYSTVVVSVDTLTGEIAGQRLRSRRLGVSEGVDVILDLESGPYSCARRTTEPMHEIVATDSLPYLFAEVRLNPANATQLNTYEELSAAGEPFFTSAEQAAAELLFGVPMQKLRNDSTPRVVFALSDERGAIAAVKHKIDGLHVQVRGTEANDSVIRGTWRMSEEQVEWRHEDRQVINNLAILPAREMPYEATLLLVSRMGEKLDRRSWTANYGSRPESDMPTSAEQVERWLAELEHAQLEYKQQLGKENNDAFAKDVCAFANSSGGIVLVGVADDGEVIGYPAAGMAPRKVKDQITQVISSLVEPVPSYAIESAESNGLPIWVVRVEEGNQKPYTLGDTIYIRDHAVSRPAQRDEQVALIAGPADPHGLIRW